MLKFLKLGGSLITNKSKTKTARLNVVTRLAGEIASAKAADPGLQLLIGHGSGSFGHVPAKKYGTREGVRSVKEWLGFAEVWHEAAALNHLVVDALSNAGLATVAFAPSASVRALNGRIVSWDTYQLRTTLQSGLLPVVYGDVVFDEYLGGTILSTEDLFFYLAHELHPERILLAGIEPGVWSDYPECTHLFDEITIKDSKEIHDAVEGSDAPDVTGGMASKVALSLKLVEELPRLDICIFSGDIEGMLLSALSGKPVGTRIHYGNPGDK